jgi:hypothetical protein
MTSKNRVADGLNCLELLEKEHEQRSMLSVQSKKSRLSSKRSPTPAAKLLRLSAKLLRLTRKAQSLKNRAVNTSFATR